MSPLRLIQGAAFDPEATRLMGLAYETACVNVGTEEKSVRELIAKRIIEAAKSGERDVQRLASYHAIVHSAGIQDRDGGIALLATLFGRFPFLTKLFADSAYQGPIFGSALAKILPCLETKIVRRSDQAKGFVRLPKRWIVERTIAWLNRCRRLAKDWENLNRNALAFLKLASIRLMLRKLCNP